MNRIVFLDIAKAICIILVVVGHYMPDNSPMWYVMLNKVIYTFHMPLFMFVSGYVYIATKKDISYGSFLMKKVKRLMLVIFFGLFGHCGGCLLFFLSSKQRRVVMYSF